MDRPAVRIAVVGTGLIGPRHAASIVRSAHATLCCVVDPGPQAQAVADELGVPLFASIQDMLDSDRRPDAALVCTPNHTHAAVAAPLLRHAIPVLVEKPLAATIPDAQHLLRLAAQSGSKLLVGHHRRFHPYITATKHALAAGAIGTPLAVSGIWALRKPAAYFAPPAAWRTQPDAGGGPVLINMIHDVDALQYLFGAVTRVHAERTAARRGFAVEEGAAVLLRFASGLVGTFVLSDAAPSPHSFESGTGENPAIPRTGKDFYRAFGSEGTLSVGDMKMSRYAEGGAEGWGSEVVETSVPVGEEVPFDEQIEHFVRVVRGEEEPRCSGMDGLRALVVCDAIKRALAKDDGVVDIDVNLMQ